MRYSETLSAACVLLLACSDTSIGSDECTGEHTRCDVTEIITRRTELPTPTDTMVLADSDALPELQPEWQRALEIFPEQSPDRGELSERSGKLVGNGQAGLWYVKGSGGAKIEVHQLDEEGASTASTLIEQPRSTLIDQPGREFFAGAAILNDEGRAPVLTVNWASACVGPGVTDCGNPVLETVALQEDLKQAPLRVQHDTMRSFAPAYAVAGDDGLWTFGTGSLRKYDVQGSLAIQQTLLAQASPYPSMLDVQEWGQPPEALIAATASGSLYVYSFASDGRPELWRLDAHGNVEQRYRAPLDHWGVYHFYRSGLASLAVDREERPVMFVETIEGDLMIYRFDSERNEAEVHLVPRDDFTTLAPISLSEDRAGNLYVLSMSGPRKSPVPMLCKLPLSGALSCFTLPTLAEPLALDVLRVVGGADDVVYVHAYAANQLSPSVNETLARFELP